MRGDCSDRMGKASNKRDSGPTNAVGPKEAAKAFVMKENAMSEKGLGHIVANGSKIENC